jgi:hypothetical protein
MRSNDIPINSPVVRLLPGLLDVHRLALHLHARLEESGDDLHRILDGWVLAELKAQLDLSRQSLEAAARIVERGRSEL